MESRGRLSLLEVRTPLISSLVLASLVLTSVVLVSATEAQAKVYLTREDGLRLAFGDSLRVAARTAFLEPEQIERIRTRARAPFEAARITFYEGLGADSTAQLFAYTDTHVVRSMTETVLVVLQPDGRVVSVEVLAFDEPEDYLAPKRWLALWAGKSPAESNRRDAGLPNLAGSTLTATAISEAIRRVQAAHEVLHPLPLPEPAASGMLPSGEPR